MASKSSPNKIHGGCDITLVRLNTCYQYYSSEGPAHQQTDLSSDQSTITFRKYHGTYYRDYRCASSHH